MNLGYLLALLAIVCALGATVIGGQIANELRARGIAANPLLLRPFIFRYLRQYKEVTLKETGHVGPLYSRCTNLYALGGLLGVAALLVLLL